MGLDPSPGAALRRPPTRRVGWSGRRPRWLARALDRNGCDGAHRPAGARLRRPRPRRARADRHRSVERSTVRPLLGLGGCARCRRRPGLGGAPGGDPTRSHPCTSPATTLRGLGPGAGSARPPAAGGPGRGSVVALPSRTTGRRAGTTPDLAPHRSSGEGSRPSPRGAGQRIVARCARTHVERLDGRLLWRSAAARWAGQGEPARSLDHARRRWVGHRSLRAPHP